MATILEMNNSMTIFFYKSNGDIHSLATGIQELGVFFGDHAADYELILDTIVVAKDDYVISNASKFKINIETKALEMLPNAIEYPIANI